MSKKTILSIALNSVFVIVFNAIFFMIGGFEHPASVWISYGFIHFSYLMIPISPFLTRQSRSASIFGLTILFVSKVYFLVEIVIGVFAFLIRSESYYASLIFQILITEIYGAALLINLISNENSTDNIEMQEAEVMYIKNAALQVLNLVGKSPDKTVNKRIEKVYDLIHSSPIKTIPGVNQLKMRYCTKFPN